MEQQARLPLWFLVANWLLVLLAFAVGVYLGGMRRIDIPEPQRTALELVLEKVVEDHVDAHAKEALLERALAGMVGTVREGLDDYTRYVPPAEAAAWEEQATGQHEGVGVALALLGDDVVVAFPWANGPAERAGVLPGDRIAAIDGSPLAEVERARRRPEAERRVRGPAGTEVRLQLLRDGKEPFDVTIARGAVTEPTVKWLRALDAEAGLFTAHLTDFHQGSTDELAHALADADADAAEAGTAGLRGLVLDLRGNGGGNLSEGIAAARLFLKEGKITSLRRRGSEVVEEHFAKPEQCRYPALPLVLLVDERTASASELFAGALQDHGRAAVVGVRTYGKGFVNTIYSWKGYDFRLKLTTAHYFTPNGRNIDNHRARGGDRSGTNGTGGAHGAHGTDGTDEARGGIVPDREATLDEAQRRAVRIALQHDEPPARHRAAYAALAQSRGITVPAPIGPDGDAQLAAALAALRDRVAAANGGGAPK